MKGMTYTSLGYPAVVGDMPRRVETLVCTVLAHGTDPDTVWHLNATDFKWREKLGDWITGWLNSGRTASYWILLRGKERDAFGGDIWNWL